MFEHHDHDVALDVFLNRGIDQEDKENNEKQNVEEKEFKKEV